MAAMCKMNTLSPLINPYMNGSPSPRLALVSLNINVEIAISLLWLVGEFHFEMENVQTNMNTFFIERDGHRMQHVQLVTASMLIRVSPEICKLYCSLSAVHHNLFLFYLVIIVHLLCLWMLCRNNSPTGLMLYCSPHDLKYNFLPLVSCILT
jgi:hypothetical protein